MARPIPLFNQQSCLCGLNFHTGTRIYSYLSLVFYLIVFVLTATSKPSNENEREEFLRIFGLESVSIFMAILTALVVYGSYKKSASLYLPFLSMKVVMIFVNLFVIIWLIVSGVNLLAYQKIQMQGALFYTLYGFLALLKLLVDAYFGVHVVNESRKLVKREKALNAKLDEEDGCEPVKHVKF